MARFVRYITSKDTRGNIIEKKKEYPSMISDLQEYDAIFLSPTEDTRESIDFANSILAEKGLAIANYRKEIADKETGEITVYRFVGKPMPACEWGE